MGGCTHNMALALEVHNEFLSSALNSICPNVEHVIRASVSSAVSRVVLHQLYSMVACKRPGVGLKLDSRVFFFVCTACWQHGMESVTILVSRNVATVEHGYLRGKGHISFNRRFGLDPCVFCDCLVTHYFEAWAREVLRGKGYI